MTHTYLIVDVIDNRVTKDALAQCDASNLDDAISVLCDDCMIDLDDVSVRERNDTYFLFDVDDDETFIIARIDHMSMLYDYMFMN